VLDRRQDRIAGRSAPAATRFRPDIEGLRALAVVLVVLNHLTGFPAGGFIGVDVFFVISGFLITGLLLAETERHGRLSVRGFYLRRARRILPAALTVLAACVLTAHLIFRGARVAQTDSDTLWSLGFAANIHFAELGTDYFQADRAPSLVQHFWSLAVEEQFYLVWPLVIILVMSVIGRRATRRWSRPLLLTVILAGCAASFAFSLIQTHDQANVAYFSSPGRAWELGVGAVIALAARRGHAGPDRLGRARGPIWLLAVAVIVVSALVVPDRPGFPAPWAALPVLAAGVVIAVGVRGPLGGAWPIALTNPISRYLGRISYSLYLWHWPVIVATAALIPHAPGYRYPIAVLIMLGLSVAGYHLVESPGRRLGKRRTVRPPAARTRRRWPAARPVALAVGCLSVAAVLVAFIPTPAAPPVAATRAGGLLPLPRVGLAQPAPQLASAIDTALGARGFPTLTPPLSQQNTARDHWGHCDEVGPDEVNQCVFGSSADTAKVAVVMGDSIAMSWLPGIVAALGNGWRVVGLTFEACPAADIPVVNTSNNYHSDCDTHHAWATQAAVALHPQLIVLSSAEDTLVRLADHARGAQAAAEYESASGRTIDQLQGSGAQRIVTLSPPPMSGPLSDCDTVGGTPADCVRPISDQWVSLATADAATARVTKTAYVDTHRWFCSNAGFCPSFIGTTAVKYDGQHMTDEYAKSLASQLRPLLN
jgi:peptidoglycan/LPS O-acetylase OafA/YrhL